jgi:type VI secretion system protein ImpG
LSLYNWNQDINNPDKKKIQAITRVHPPSPKHIMQDKGLIRGIEFKIEVDETQFENGEGDIRLFGTVLSRFLSQYVTINSFVILTIIEAETKKQHTWTPKIGKISPV